MFFGVLRGFLLSFGLLLVTGSASAANYQFPGNLPSGCTSAGGNAYACNSLTLADVDTITIVNKPATITFSGLLNTRAAQINASGSTADLTLHANAGLITASGARIVGTVNTSSLSDAGGTTITGNLSATGSGSLILGAASRVNGNVTGSGSGSGSVSLGNAAVVTGSASTGTGALVLNVGARVEGALSSTSGTIYLYNSSTAGSTITCSCSVLVWSAVTVQGHLSSNSFDNGAGSSTFNGSVTAANGNLVLGSTSAVAGSVSATNGTVYLYSNSSVAGNATSHTYDVNVYANARVGGSVLAAQWVHAWNNVVIGGTTTGRWVDAAGGYYNSYGGNVIATGGWVSLDHHSTVAGAVTAASGFVTLGEASTVTGAVSATGGDVNLVTSTRVDGAVTSSDTVNVWWSVSIGGAVTATRLNGWGYYVNYGGDVYVTTGGATIGNESTVAGSLRSTTGNVALQGGADVLGNLFCACTLSTNSANVVGSVDVTTLNDSGASTFRAGVQTRDAANLGNGSSVTGDLSSLEGSATQGAASSVTGCVRSRGGSITLWNASGTGGVCCGTASCSSSCVNNYRGAAMPGTCSSTLPRSLVEYRFEEASWSGASGEVIDSSGNRPARRLGSVSPTVQGRVCKAASIPADTSSVSQAIATDLALASDVGNRGSISFWYKASAAWASLPAGELFDATTVSGKSFHLVRLATGSLKFVYTDGWGGVHSVTTAAQSIAANTWVHIAVTWSVDLFNGRLKLYVNGVATSAALSTLGGIDASIGTLYIGDSRANLTTQDGSINSAAGLIDEFHLHRTELSSTEISRLMALTRSCAAPPGTLVAGQRYSFESYDWPGWFIRHQNFLGKVSQYSASPTPLERNDATFIARAGLADSNCWSFESVNYPGYYLRHSLSVLHLHTQSTSGTYPQDATFCLRAGLADSAAISLESLNLPGNFIYHQSDGMLSIASNNGSVAYAGTATFRVIAPFELGMDHVEIRHASGTGLTCTPSTVTILACNDATCSTPYTGGLTGNLTSSGVNVVWPSGAAFSIPAGSSSTTVSLQLTSPGTALLGLSGLNNSVLSSNSCNFGSPACTFTAADAGLLLDVPNHLADVSNTVKLSAVRKSDNSLDCVPALANVTRPVTFACSYTNPSSGSLPVRVGSVALNAGANSAAACDAGGRSLNLAFNGSGVATTTVQYADVGAVSLTATYSGSAGTGDAGLKLTGSDSFIAAPASFSVDVAAGVKTAGSSFSASASAHNASGAVTPNFGRETPAESMSAGWVRTQPQGIGASNGSFSGSFSNFSGSASAANLVWSEVGRGDLTVVLSSGSYLGSGYTMAGSSAGAPVPCGSERSFCTVPTGATATILYGANGKLSMRSGVTGSLMCDNSQFTDPNVGVTKSCWYVLTSGASAATSGAVGRFLPHHYNLVATPACGAFSYAGQPFGVSIEGLNAAGQRTVNLDGGANLSPAFAQALTLSDAGALGQGSLSASSLAATVFNKGVGAGTVSYAFTQKLTGPQSLSLRAVDADGVSTQGFVEGSMALRSGRLVMSNAFGSEKAPLLLPLRLQYWSGKSWVLSSDDSCTSVPVTAVARSSPVLSNGAAASWTSVVSSVSLSGGVGGVSLQAPSGGGTGSVDLALNLGTGVADLSCLGSHPASVGAGLPWLRARAGSCAATQDRDPSARATFGIFAPETRKTIHTRELF